MHLKIGGVKVIIDVGWYRDEVNTILDPYVDLTNGQQHVVRVRRANKGSTLTIQVDLLSHKSVSSCFILITNKKRNEIKYCHDFYVFTEYIMYY